MNRFKNIHSNKKFKNKKFQKRDNNIMINNYKIYLTVQVIINQIIKEWIVIFQILYNRMLLIQLLNKKICLLNMNNMSKNISLLLYRLTK
jgi:hypothetical protein